MVAFTIDFDKPDKNYIAGETVRCKIQINVHSKFKARSLSVRFKGFAHTEWTKSRTVTSGGKTRTVHDRYTGDQEFFKSVQFFIGSENSGEHEIEAKTYYYEAQFILPENLPSNIEHSNGHIRYNVKVKYDIAWGFDKDYTAPFSVSSKLDLNEFPELREPVKQIKEKIFGCCCCESDPMQMINLLPKKGFVPGDVIPITIEIDNNSDVRIDFIKVKLKEHTNFITHSPRTDTRSDSRTLNEHFFHTAVAPFQKKIFETTFYLDPSIDYKLFNGCAIIYTEYFIKSEAESSGCHTNPENSTNITIGTIPFINNTMTNGSNNVVPVMMMPSAPAIFNPTAPPGGVIVEQPLPSYHEITANAPSPFMSPSTSGGIGWNVGLKTPSGAPLASTEKIDQPDLPPPSFEESQKNPKLVLSEKAKEAESGDMGNGQASAPPPE
uniref:CSON004664 protein n=1 Tax=Culicoides sonorensis TaxID=179676 RepID=A0A336LUC5_CULSO